ncbi:universal stress protein [Aureimonas endophytica]|uniref:Universal stress protein n=1 Tax=Aureimonas endophytica TaxID=2027858 RepID=A0A916ZEF5_9HYPH|nr:universal stress protein [Aureimonas endophytica]GGD91828.1 universal stress protein [Aureimonas endophytica]
MTDLRFASVMVGVDAGVGTEARVGLAAEIAHRFAGLTIGIAAEAVPLALYTDAAEAFDEEFVLAEQKRIDDRLGELERLFRRAAGGASEWRQAIDEPTGFLVRQAVAADLVVLGRGGPDDPALGRTGIDLGEAVIGASRPVLIVPPHDERAAARHVLVAWKDTHEARRVVADALPFLRLAEEVTVLTIGEEREVDGLDDICRNLERHSVRARPLRVAVPQGSIADEIILQAEQRGADLLVAGAYGHGRLREWIFGGVTHELLRRTPCPCLLSR